jgi:transposase
MLFLRHLISQLDRDTPGWQENSLILLDNAPYHGGVEIRENMRKMQVPVIYSAAYCYSSAPIETLFAHLKLG